MDCAPRVFSGNHVSVGKFVNFYASNRVMVT